MPLKSRNGKLLRASATTLANTCAPQQTFYRQMRRCKDNVLVNKWAIELLGLPLIIKDSGDSICYIADSSSPRSTTPGQLVGSFLRLSSCTDVRCQTHPGSCCPFDGDPVAWRVEYTGLRVEAFGACCDNGWGQRMIFGSPSLSFTHIVSNSPFNPPPATAGCNGGSQLSAINLGARLYHNGSCEEPVPDPDNPIHYFPMDGIYTLLGVTPNASPGSRAVFLETQLIAKTFTPQQSGYYFVFQGSVVGPIDTCRPIVVQNSLKLCTPGYVGPPAGWASSDGSATVTPIFATSRGLVMPGDPKFYSAVEETSDAATVRLVPTDAGFGPEDFA